MRACGRDPLLRISWHRLRLRKALGVSIERIEQRRRSRTRGDDELRRSTAPAGDGRRPSGSPADAGFPIRASLRSPNEPLRLPREKIRPRETRRKRSEVGVGEANLPPPDVRSADRICLPAHRKILPEHRISSRELAIRFAVEHTRNDVTYGHRDGWFGVRRLYQGGQMRQHAQSPALPREARGERPPERAFSGAPSRSGGSPSRSRSRGEEGRILGEEARGRSPPELDPRPPTHFPERADRTP